eukprot:Nk52_evm38s215 gene=Nk52_evmTU38s215
MRKIYRTRSSARPSGKFRPPGRIRNSNEAYRCDANAQRMEDAAREPCMEGNYREEFRMKRLRIESAAAEVQGTVANPLCQDFSSEPRPNEADAYGNSIFNTGDEKENAFADCMNFDYELELDSQVHISPVCENSGGESAQVSKNVEFLTKYGVPESVACEYYDLGIRSLYEWQRECLELPGVCEGKNLIYSAPTSAGKTMVAEILLMKRLHEKKGKCLFVLPFISVVCEKEKYFKRIFASASMRVGAYYGSHNGPSLEDVDLAICTIEKANSMCNNMVANEKIHELSVVVVDELHMLSDEERGYIIEILLGKIMFVNKQNTKIIGMSATLPSLDLVKNWLDAEVYVTDFRPVQLDEFIMCEGKLYAKGTSKTIKTYSYPSGSSSDAIKDPDRLCPLVKESTKDGHGVLVFCPTRDRSEKCAMLIATNLRGTNGSTKERLVEVLGELEKCSTGLDTVLSRIIPNGVAFHHAGLTIEERDIIERSFREGKIKVLCATSTLASGVNLPSRRVIFRSVQRLEKSDYDQRKGRAGRKGLDSKGESIIMCQKTDVKKVNSVLTQPLPALVSRLREEDKGLERLLIEALSYGIISNDMQALKLVSCMFLSREVCEKDLSKATEETLMKLSTNEFIRQSNNVRDGASFKSKVSATKLGIASSASCMEPRDGLIVLKELQKASNALILSSELHLIYLVTPVNARIRPNWPVFSKAYHGLKDAELEVSKTIGVSERFISTAHRIRTDRPQSNRIQEEIRIHNRFYSALILYDLIREVPVAEVASKFELPRGHIQSHQASSSAFCGMVEVFCEKLGWHSLQVLFQQFKDRLHFGVEYELCELMKIEDMSAKCARVCFNEGLKTVSSVAVCSSQKICALVEKSLPFKSERLQDTGSARKSYAALAKKVIKQARRLVKQEKDELVLNAEKLALCLEDNCFENSSRRKTEESVAKTAKETDSMGNDGAIFEMPPSRLSCSGKLSLSSRSSTQELSLSQIAVSGVENIRDFLLFVEGLKQCEVFSFNLYVGENGLLNGILFSWDERSVKFIDFGKLKIQGIDNQLLLHTLKPFLENKTQMKVVVCMKDVWKYFIRHGISLSTECYDPVIANWLKDPKGDTEDLERIYLKYSNNMLGNNIVLSPLARAAKEVVAALVIYNKLSAEPDYSCSYNYLTSIEAPISHILGAMELNGFGFRKDTCDTLKEKLSQTLNDLEAEAYQCAGVVFSLTSPAEISRVLFGTLQLPYPMGKNNSIIEGVVKYSTAKETLEKLTHLHRLPALIIEHRRLSGMLTKCIYPLWNISSYSGQSGIDRIHPQTNTFSATGRICISSPCLQNIPNEFALAFPKGGLDSNINIREAFQAGNEHVLLCTDYSQIELRILAHLSCDTDLIRLLNVNEDAFKCIASELYEVERNNVTSEMRKKTKQLCYAMIYGIGLKNLAIQMKCSEEDAKGFLRKFKSKFKNIDVFVKETVTLCRSRGFCETLGGRRRYLEHIHSTEPKERFHAERQAINSSIQGSAADLVKKAMIKIENALDEKYGPIRIYPLEKQFRPEGRPLLVLQMHDEVVYEVHESQVSSVSQIVKSCMENVLPLRVKLPVKSSIGKQWGRLKPITE